MSPCELITFKATCGRPKSSLESKKMPYYRVFCNKTMADFCPPICSSGQPPAAKERITESAITNILIQYWNVPCGSARRLERNPITRLLSNLRQHLPTPDPDHLRMIRMMIQYSPSLPISDKRRTRWTRWYSHSTHLSINVFWAMCPAWLWVQRQTNLKLMSSLNRCCIRT